MDRLAKITIPTSSVLSVPTWLQRCPYCDGRLFARFSAFTECRDGRWKAESVELECEKEPELDENDEDSSREWYEYEGTHYYMPYVYWLPACMKVERWVNRFYRFPA